MQIVIALIRDAAHIAVLGDIGFLRHSSARIRIFLNFLLQAFMQVFRELVD